MDEPSPIVRLRPTDAADLDFVVALERSPENAAFVGQWSRDEHHAAIADARREHHVIHLGGAGDPVGYLIAYDLLDAGFEVYVKRDVVAEKSRGVGRLALRQFADHAFRDLGAQYVWLSVFAGNVRAQRSYAALGFRVAELAAQRRAAMHAAVGGFSDRSLIMMLDR